MNDLFTVLIAEKEHIDAVRQENKLFFEPFLDNKELAFCYWNPAGQNLRDSVPGLLDTVGHKKEWRAVILNSPKGDFIKAQNPFDVVDYSAIASLETPSPKPEAKRNWDDWENEWKAYYDALLKEKRAVYCKALENPLSKLSTWLCFRPEDYILNEVKEKQDVTDWALEMINQDEIKPSVRLERLEKKQYKEELRLKESIRRDFVGKNYLSIAYPQEVHCITTRTAESGFFDPDKYWNIKHESDYSAFADRNMFFDKMRFMVFDLFPENHRNFRNDYIRFLATALIFAENPLPGSAMQARRLYSFETETDDTPLCTLITSYDKKLAATSEVIDCEIEKIRSEIPGELTDKVAEAMFCTPKDVTVAPDESFDSGKIFAENDYNLFFDMPENEFHKWNASFGDSKKELARMIKQRGRAVRKSAAQLQLTDESLNMNIRRITPFQMDDIRDFTETSENEMVNSIPDDFVDYSRYEEKLEKESEAVKKVIRKRMTRKTTLALGAVCIGMFIICFAPFILSNSNTIMTLTTSLVLSGIMAAVFAIILVAALFVLRFAIRNAVNMYNNAMHSITSEINASARQYPKYLSAMFNVKRGYAIQNYAKKNVDVYTRSLRIRKKHQEDIRKRRAFLAEEYRDYLCDRSFCDETLIQPYEYDFDQKTEYEYPVPFFYGDSRQVEFINSGNYVSVPSSYVKSISVKMEEIYDR